MPCSSRSFSWKWQIVKSKWCSAVQTQLALAQIQRHSPLDWDDRSADLLPAPSVGACGASAGH